MTSGLEKVWRHIYSRALNDVWRAGKIALVNNVNYTEPALNVYEFLSCRMCVDTNTCHLLDIFRHCGSNSIWSDGMVKQSLRKYPIPEILLLYSEYLKASEDTISIIIYKKK